MATNKKKYFEIWIDFYTLTQKKMTFKLALEFTVMCSCVKFPWHGKGGFFQKVQFVFQISKSPKKIFRKTILNLKFKFPANNSEVILAGNLNFKLRIVFWNIFFFEFFEVWKTHRTFWKKRPLASPVRILEDSGSKTHNCTARI